MTRRVTRWLIDHVLARRGFEIGMREALGAIVRYVVASERSVCVELIHGQGCPARSATMSQSRSNSTSRNASAEAPAAVAEMIREVTWTFPSHCRSRRLPATLNGNGVWREACDDSTVMGRFRSPATHPRARGFRQVISGQETP